MKLMIRNSLLFFFLFMSIALVVIYKGQILSMLYEVFDKDESRLTIVNVDAKTGKPIKNTEYKIIDVKTNNTVEILKTFSNGQVTSSLLDTDTAYKVLQTNVIKPYKIIDKQYIVELNDNFNLLITKNHMPKYIKDYHLTQDNEIKITDLQLTVDTVLQNPELPNGCEVTALTAVLKYYGYETSKTVLANTYLPKLSFTRSNNRLYGPSPYEAYVGDPSRDPGGFFSYAPPIIKTAERFFKDVEGNHTPKNISGSTREEILNMLKKGVPVIVWITRDMKKPHIDYSWYIPGTEKIYNALSNSHTVVLTGFNKDSVYTMDPLKGQVTHYTDTFFRVYKLAGSHAMVIR
ncbi:C39 family peptidase [Virgibacillus oceani]|uniref:Peptidase C39-like domain-containing protein n=1 Tax=Virgibacillus oceani TaxID=1479511 RepID=A0A917GYE9_9BACI|nr:C39 family peptidase [Virgibacillus oceani]GGG61187.1 hypothetical protein GCM10011398_00570 [Virgibacillus oceani]